MDYLRRYEPSSAGKQLHRLFFDSNHSFMHIKRLLPFALSAALLSACNPKNRITTLDYTVENRLLDTLSVTATRPGYQRPVYQAAPTRTHDLIHTKLDVSFDWSKQHLNGKAVLELKPIYQARQELRLDAKGFDIHKVALMNTMGQVPLQYRYENNKDLYITLDRPYKAGELFRVYITYTAKPNELPIGGSQAITSDKGLYFINPLGEEVGKPQQIWTQGETESSSCWFPTIDRPNERCTQEIYMTVQDRFKTLSNGVLVNSIQNSDGTRTDYWKQELPHAPYLFAMVVGEFAVVEEEWNGKLLQYYVEPQYEPHAKAIFRNTPQMITFFSDKLGVEYPWAKYSQAVVRDYVSGAMENTTAVIFGDFVQKTTRELLDNSDLNEGIVAHELMHHWFGDLATCESWSNLPLNESFANYSEYLWFEHQYGRDAADYLHKRSIDGYMNQAVANSSMHPLIYYGYDDKEDMFDAHSYNKGGAILHMLRYYVGDEAFFKSLKRYLNERRFKAAEAAHLRLAFEEVTGQDLNWFFDQWFFKKGHPELMITKTYDAVRKEVQVTIEQEQNIRETSLFILPFAIDVYTSSSGKPLRTMVTMDQQKQTFAIPVSREPLWVAVDAERVLLAKRSYKLTKDEYVQQFRLGQRYQDRAEALIKLQYEQKGDASVQQVFESALNDPFWAIRRRAVDDIVIEQGQQSRLDKIVRLARKDPRSQVRSAAIERLGELGQEEHLAVIEEAAQKDQSYLVSSRALQAIYDNNPAKGTEYAEKLQRSDNTSILLTVAQIFQKTGERRYIPFFENNWKKTDNYARFTFFSRYAALLQNIGDEQLILEKGRYFKDLATNDNTSTWGRYAAASALNKLRMNYYTKVQKDYEEIQKAIKQLKGNDPKDALDKLEILMDDKSTESYDDAVDAIERLNGDNKMLRKILERVEAFAQVNTYDNLSVDLDAVRQWEQNPSISKLYQSWK